MPPAWTRNISPFLALHCKRTCRAFSDPLFYGALALGFAAWLLPTGKAFMPWTDLVLRGLAEEILFRALLQDMLEQSPRFRPGWAGITRANVATSALFALAHLAGHPPLWALGVFFPSLAFGWAWTRYRTIIPCWLLHFGYNFCLFYKDRIFTLLF